MARQVDPEQWAAYVREMGDHLFRIRSERGMSQENVASTAGLTRYTYQRLEKGLGTTQVAANPTLLTLTLVARALDVGLEDFLPTKELGGPNDGSSENRGSQ